MTNIDEKIAKLKAEKQAELDAEIKEVERDGAALQLCPDDFVAERTSYSGYNDTTVYTYTAKSVAEVVAIIDAWRDKYGPFRSVNKYLNGCCVVSAYGYKEYTDDYIKATAGDAVVACNDMGRGFDSQKFVFYPAVDGLRAVVSIDIEFRCNVPGFSGYINTQADKREPQAFKKAGYVVTFGCGSRDSANWYGVFNYDALKEVTNGTTVTQR